MAASTEARPLSKQEVVNLLDSIPTFKIVTEADGKIVGTVADENGEECVRWWTDPDEAGSALVLAQHLKPDVPLRLAVTPLGTAFALSAGWSPNQSSLPLKLHASTSVVAGAAEELGAAADADAFPLFCCDELSSNRVRPFFLSREDLAATWVSAGRSADALPSELTCVALPQLAKMMLAAHGGIEWRTAMFIGSQKALEKAQAIGEAEAQAATAKAAASDPDAEPPPLA